MTINLRAALAPRSIAVIGASERSSIARTTIENCRRLGYPGAIYPIHPRGEPVLGLPCFPRLSDLPAVPDCALIALNAERAVDVVEEAAAMGVAALVLPAGGYAERGPAGVERQRRVVEAARTHGTCVIGPNCMGLISMPDRAAVYIGTIPRPAAAGNVSVVAQSGSVAHLIVNTPEIDLARVFSSGNEATLSTCDYLEFLLEDDATAVIMLYLEAHREPQRLLRLAERALDAGKPLVTLALGRSVQSQAMAQAHSGALATSFRRVSAALAQRGVILCDDMDEWIVTAQLAAQGQWPRGAGIGAVTVSGGEASYLLDLAGACGVDFPPLSASLQHRLSAACPGFDGWTNPADGWDKGPWEEVIPAMLSALADEPAVDVLVVAVDVPSAQGDHEADYTSVIGRALGEHAARAGKPAIYLSPAGGSLDERVRAALRAHNTPLVGSARWGLRAIAQLAGFTRARGRRSAGNAPPLDVAKLTSLVHSLPFGASDEHRSRQVLEAAGIPLLPAKEVGDTLSAVSVAATLGAPAVLKAIIPGLAHKSDAGAVAPRLTTAADVEKAADRLLALCGEHSAPRRLLVSPYVEPALELICGITCDPDWGAFVVLGLGGVLAEALDEVVIAAAPLLSGEAESLVSTGRLGRVIASSRRPTDMPALAALLDRLGWLAHRLWSIDPTVAVDINPVMLMPPGRGAWAADALVTRGIAP